jgi:hypothetical protein
MRVVSIIPKAMTTVIGDQLIATGTVSGRMMLTGKRASEIGRVYKMGEGGI